jgi:hypothetical protein
MIFKIITRPKAWWRNLYKSISARLTRFLIRHSKQGSTNVIWRPAVGLLSDQMKNNVLWQLAYVSVYSLLYLALTNTHPITNGPDIDIKSRRNPKDWSVLARPPEMASGPRLHVEASIYAWLEAVVGERRKACLPIPWGCANPKCTLLKLHTSSRLILIELYLTQRGFTFCDATRISDGAYVHLKVVSPSLHPHEAEISAFVSSKDPLLILATIAFHSTRSSRCRMKKTRYF